jgi:hypothetical protein
MREMKCLSCKELTEFGDDWYPREGRVTQNQLAGICTSCVRDIMSDKFWP